MHWSLINLDAKVTMVYMASGGGFYSGCFQPCLFYISMASMPSMACYYYKQVAFTIGTLT